VATKEVVDMAAKSCKLAIEEKGAVAEKALGIPEGEAALGLIGGPASKRRAHEAVR